MHQIQAFAVTPVGLFCALYLSVAYVSCSITDCPSSNYWLFSALGARVDVGREISWPEYVLVGSLLP